MGEGMNCEQYGWDKYSHNAFKFEVECVNSYQNWKAKKIHRYIYKNL